MPIKWTNELIDNHLKDTNRSLKRIDNYIKSDHRIQWECLLDGYIWLAPPKNILNIGSGCPKCAGNLPITNEFIDTNLKDRDILRLDNCVNNRTNIRWQCLKTYCNKIWLARPESILRNKNRTGCPNCNQGIWNNTKIDLALQDRSIKRLSDVINSSEPMKWLCLKSNCNYVWETSIGHIIHNKSECPKCGIVGRDAKLMIDLIKNANIKYEVEYNIKNYDKKLPNYKLDIFIQSIQMAIEYNGAQHYIPSTFGYMSKEEAKKRFEIQQNRDQFVRNFCKNNQIDLVEIDGRKYKSKKLEIYLIEKLIPYIKEKFLNKFN